VNIWGLLIWTGLFPQSWRPALAARASRPIFGWRGSYWRGSEGWVGRAFLIALPWGAVALDFFVLAGLTNLNLFNLPGAAAAVVFAGVALVAIPKWALPFWFREWLATRPNEAATITMFMAPRPPSSPSVKRHEGHEPRADVEGRPGWTLGAGIVAVLATLWALVSAFAQAMQGDLNWSSWPPGDYVRLGVEVLGLFLGPIALVLGFLFPFHSWRWGLWLTWPQVPLGFAIHRGCPIAPPCTANDPEPALMPFVLIALVCSLAWFAAAARHRLSR
jgi:hypothetical protein